MINLYRSRYQISSWSIGWPIFLSKWSVSGCFICLGEIPKHTLDLLYLHMQPLIVHSKCTSFFPIPIYAFFEIGFNLLMTWSSIWIVALIIINSLRHTDLERVIRVRGNRWRNANRIIQEKLSEIKKLGFVPIILVNTKNSFFPRSYMNCEKCSHSIVIIGRSPFEKCATKRPF